jgi:hypothetical protein
MLVIFPRHGSIIDTFFYRYPNVGFRYVMFERSRIELYDNVHTLFYHLCDKYASALRANGK